MTQPLDICTACGQRPTCAIADAAVLVWAKDRARDLASWWQTWRTP